MAVGSYDANGIWQYGESDNISPFATTLNKLASSASSAFTSDRSRLATLEAGSLAGLIPVAPTSVSVAGGTAAANSVGTVTFTNATSISLNSVFTSKYKNYRVMLNFTGFSANNDVFLRLRAAGTDSTSSYTYAGNVMNTASAAGSWVANNASYFHLASNFATYANRARHFFEIWQPQSPIFTSIFWNSFADNGTVWNHLTASGTHTVTAQYDGLTLYPSAGNMTGTITVYGWNN